MKVVATKREAQGSRASRRLRHGNKVPGIIYGGSETAQPIAIDHNPLWHSLKVEAFHSSILDMELDGQPQRVVLRDVQYHAYRQQVLHIDFQRVAADEAIHMAVPIHFINAENSPAVRLGSAVINHVLNEIEVSCLPDKLPQFIEVDLGALEVDGSIHLSQIKLPDGVSAVVTTGAADPVIAIAAVPEEEPAADGAAAGDGADAPKAS